jgi:acyl dehydratase
MYLDDLRIGQKFASAGMTLTESMIVDFAAMYDPQPFHIDAVAAQHGPFAGLIASGFQTLALSFRLLHMTGLTEGGGVGGSGIDEMRWPRPVRPGDTLTVEAEIKDIRISKRDPERATVSLAYATFNQHGECVMTAVFNQLFRRRRPDEK